MPSLSGVDTSQSSPGQTWAWDCGEGCASAGALLSLSPLQLARRKRDVANRKGIRLHLLHGDMRLLLSRAVAGSISKAWKGVKGGLGLPSDLQVGREPGRAAMATASTLNHTPPRPQDRTAMVSV